MDENLFYKKYKRERKIANLYTVIGFLLIALLGVVSYCIFSAPQVVSCTELSNQIGVSTSEINYPLQEDIDWSLVHKDIDWEGSE